MKKRSGQIVIVVILVIVIGIYGSSLMDVAMESVASRVTNSVEGIEETKIVVIDPGHGGDDPGKVGINGALEKDINLAIGIYVKEVLEAEGLEVVMTREEDVTMVEAGAFNKAEDLKTRVDIINEVQPEIAVSIHQNSYTTENVKGPQVFYYTNSMEGEAAAQIMQELLWEIAPDSIRQITDNDSYYLLTRTEVPTIIVECGFLSNEEDAEKLVDETYQKELAEVIATGILTYMGKFM